MAPFDLHDNWGWEVCRQLVHEIAEDEKMWKIAYILNI